MQRSCNSNWLIQFETLLAFPAGGGKGSFTFRCQGKNAFFFSYFYLPTSRWRSPVALFARKQKLDTVPLKGHDSLSFSARRNVTLKTPMRASVWSERKFFKELNARHSKKTGNASQLNFAFQTYFFAYSAFDFAVAREPLSHAAQKLTESWQPIRINDNAMI